MGRGPRGQPPPCQWATAFVAICARSVPVRVSGSGADGGGPTLRCTAPRPGPVPPLARGRRRRAARCNARACFAGADGAGECALGGEGVQQEMETTIWCVCARGTATCSHPGTVTLAQGEHSIHHARSRRRPRRRTPLPGLPASCFALPAAPHCRMRSAIQCASRAASSRVPSPRARDMRGGQRTAPAPLTVSADPFSSRCTRYSASGALHAQLASQE